MDTILRRRRLAGILAVAVVAVSCSGADTSPTLTEAATTTSVTGTSAPPTTDPGLPVPVFDPSANQLILAPVPPQPPDLNDPNIPDGSADYMDLFEPDAPWADAMSVLTGFKIHGWMIKHYLTDDELVTIDRALRAAGVPLIIEAEPLIPPRPSECDHNESFEGPHELASLRRLRDLGVHVAAIAIEQPHTYAVLLDEPGACRYSLEKTLEQVKAWIADAREIYPDVVVGSIEGLWGNFEDPGEIFAEWLDGFEEAMGEPLPFIHVDVDWTRPDWADALKEVEAVADARGVPFGILYNGTLGDAETDEEWLQLTAERFAEYETVGGGTPQHVTLQSWVDLPDRLLPDTDVAAFTHLIARYAGTRTDVADLGVETDGETAYVTGRVVDPTGDPVAGQVVSAGGVPNDGTPSTAAISGIVPDFAREALVLVRVHVEGAAPGDTDVRITDIAYTEAGGDNLVPDPDFSSGTGSWPWYGDPVGEVTFDSDGMHIVAGPDEVVFVDGVQFPVTAGAEYEFSVTMGGTDASIGTIGVAIAFVADVEGARETILFAPSPIDLGTTETGADGTFRVSLPGGSDGYDAIVSVAGDARTWPVTRRMSDATPR